MISVTCAIIRNEDGKILIVQRGEKSDHPFKWEFPGGKIAPGETEEECIIREIKEELSMEIVICGKLEPVEYNYGHKQILLIPFICDTLDEYPVLSEHLACKWLSYKDLLSVDYSEADVQVAEKYCKRLMDINSPEDRNINEDYSSMETVELQAMINLMMGMKEVEWVAASAIDNQVIFKKLIDFSFSGDKKLAFKASWTLTKVCDKFPEIIYPHLYDIIEKLEKLDNEGAERCLLRIISLTDIDKIKKSQHGILADYCFKALNSSYSAIAIKAYSMEILYKLATKYPELANELSDSVNILMQEGSAGIISRGRTILKKLAEITSDHGSGQISS
jgi:8-oxo-dGTP diphosphatase